MQDKIQNDMKKQTTLIEATEELLKQNIKIAILVIDEDHRASSDPNEADSHVNEQQETVIEFAKQHNLPIFLINSNRRRLIDKVTNYNQTHNIDKGDANGFGDGCGKIPHYADTGLHNKLQDQNITHLIVMGFHVNCCVRITVGAVYDTQTYGKGALQYGYKVITSGDILRSSASSPAGNERCQWKDVDGVIYFDTLKPNISIEKNKKYDVLLPVQTSSQGIFAKSSSRHDVESQTFPLLTKKNERTSCSCVIL